MVVYTSTISVVMLSRGQFVTDFGHCKMVEVWVWYTVLIVYPAGIVGFVGDGVTAGVGFPGQ